MGCRAGHRGWQCLCPWCVGSASRSQGTQLCPWGGAGVCTEVAAPGGQCLSSRLKKVQCEKARGRGGFLCHGRRSRQLAPMAGGESSLVCLRKQGCGLWALSKKGKNRCHLCRTWVAMHTICPMNRFNEQAAVWGASPAQLGCPATLPLCCLSTCHAVTCLPATLLTICLPASVLPLSPLLMSTVLVSIHSSCLNHSQGHRHAMNF